MSPSVLIIITSYNYASFLDQCIQSCLNQKYDNFKVLVIDDGSNDESKKIIEKYPDVIKIFNANLGLEKSCNIGINSTNSDYWVRVDADDYLDKNYLMHMKKYIIQKKYLLLYSNYYEIYKSNIKKIHLPDFDKTEISRRGDFLATGTLVSRKLSNSIGCYNESSKNSGIENYDFILRALSTLNINNTFKTNHFLFYYRIHSSNMSIISKNKIIDNGKKIAKKYNLGIYSTNKYHPQHLKL